MESVIGLRFSTLPSPSVRMPSGYHSARATKPHLRLSHSSLSLPKDPRSLSLGHNSSLSLPQSSGGRPLDHIIGPLSCMVDGSLPPTHNRDHRGAANVPWASRFLRNVGWGNRSNRKAKAGSDGGAPQSRNDKIRQYQQLLGIVERLRQSRSLDVANLWKTLEPIVKEREAYNEIIGIVDKLKDSKNYNSALELLKAFEPFVEEQQSLAFIKFTSMEILCSQEKCPEAADYCIQLLNMKDNPQIQTKLPPEMQLCILRGLSQHEKAREYMKKFIESQNQDNRPALTRPDEPEDGGDMKI